MCTHRGCSENLAEIACSRLLSGHYCRPFPSCSPVSFSYFPPVYKAQAWQEALGLVGMVQWGELSSAQQIERTRLANLLIKVHCAAKSAEGWRNWKDYWFRCELYLLDLAMIRILTCLLTWWFLIVSNDCFFSNKKIGCAYSILLEHNLSRGKDVVSDARVGLCVSIAHGGGFLNPCSLII